MSLQPKRLAEEGNPVAAILLFWTVASWVFSLNPALTGIVRTAGLVMAALYVVVRGVALAPEVSLPETNGIAGIVRENARVAVSSGVWFVSAAFVHLVEQLWNDLGGPGLFTSPADWMIHVLAGAGLGVVGLYAVATGVAALRAEGVARPSLADD